MNMEGGEIRQTKIKLFILKTFTERHILATDHASVVDRNLVDHKIMVASLN